MGSRRLGRKRLHSLEKLGKSLTAAEIGIGAGMEPALVRATQKRDGLLVLTEIVLNLGTAKGTIACSADNAAIGVTGASSAIFQWNLATFGRLLEIEIVCIEQPAGDAGVADDLELINHSAEVNAGSALKGVGNNALAGDGQYVAGDVASVAITSVTSLGASYATSNVFAFAQGEASHDGAAETYTAGKFVIRITGQADPLNSDI